jgi:hypothetical protein
MGYGMGVWDMGWMGYEVWDGIWDRIGTGSETCMQCSVQRFDRAESRARITGAAMQMQAVQCSAFTCTSPT